MDRNQGKGKSKNNCKGKAMENLTMTKNAKCAEKIISHETVGHEQITTRW